MEQYTNILKKHNINILNKTGDWFDNYLNYNLKRVGIEPTLENKENYLSNKLNIEKDLDKLKGFDNVGNLITEHINKNNFILLVTDYDCDGINSAVLLTKFFRDILKYKNFETMVNKRIDGNGFNKKLVSRIMEKYDSKKIDLIITADHGSSNNEEFKFFNLHGIDCCVTDHHEIPEELTAPKAFLNVMDNDSTYKKSTSGCTVAFLACLSTFKKLYPNESLIKLEPLLQYCAITTVVDYMDISNIDNRYLVKSGLNYINSTKDFNMNLYRLKSSGPHSYVFRDFGFTFGPFFNAGNRTSQEEAVFNGFASNDSLYAERNMLSCIVNNKNRKTNQKEAFEEALKITEKMGINEFTFGIAFYMNIAAGIAGPIANTVGDNYKRPTIVFRDGIKPGIIAGSGRGIIKNFDLLKTLLKIKEDRPEIIIYAGGHAGACGIEINSDYLEEFQKLFNEYVKIAVGGEIKPDILNVDGILEPDDINASVALKVEALGPYGNNWSEPIFISELMITNLFFSSGGLFLKLSKDKNSENKDGRYWFGRDNGINKINFNEKLKVGKKCLVVYNVRLNYFQNTYSPLMDIIDIIPL